MDCSLLRGCNLFKDDSEWSALDDCDYIIFSIKVVGAAVGEQGVEEGAIRPGFEAADEHPVLHIELGGTRARLGRLSG